MDEPQIYCLQDPEIPRIFQWTSIYKEENQFSVVLERNLYNFY